MTLTALALANEDPGKKQVDNLARGECHDKISKKKRFSKKVPWYSFSRLKNATLALSLYLLIIIIIIVTEVTRYYKAYEFKY